MMHGSVSDPSFCAFVHRVAFEEVCWRGALFGIVAQGCVCGLAGGTGRASRLPEELGFRKGGSEDVEV